MLESCTTWSIHNRCMKRREEKDNIIQVTSNSLGRDIWQMSSFFPFKTVFHALTTLFYAKTNAQIFRVQNHDAVMNNINSSEHFLIPPIHARLPPTNNIINTNSQVLIHTNSQVVMLEEVPMKHGVFNLIDCNETNPFLIPPPPSLPYLICVCLRIFDCVFFAFFWQT